MPQLVDVVEALAEGIAERAAQLVRRPGGPEPIDVGDDGSPDY